MGVFGNKNKEYVYIEKSINPDPKNYKILEVTYLGNFLCLDLLYPDCTNYEGRKILVYKDIKLKDLTQRPEGIDPHFEKGKFAPIARFVPTEEGWRMALQFAQTLSPKGTGAYQGEKD